MEELALRVDIELLSEALVDATLHLTNEIRPNLRLWLLAHLIHIHRLQEGSSQRPMYMRALSTLLSSSANEIVGRVDQNESIVSAEEDDHDPELPIPSFIREELITLVNKASISGLLEKFDS
jgi:ubiquitin-protein ligase E3 C